MIIGLNNKSNLRKEEFSSYLEKLATIKTENQLILFPSTIHLAMINSKKFKLGAQNVSFQEEGAYTGEIAATQLKSYGVSFTIVGHSERRNYQKENNQEIAIKLKRLFAAGITPILCLGETMEERTENKTATVIKNEIVAAIEGLSISEKKQLIIAYEPIWAIGSGKIPSLTEIEEVFTLIKNYLPNSKLLYGGSVDENNIDILKKSPLIDGYLLGGLSLKPEKLQIFLDKIV